MIKEYYVEPNRRK